jgi:hypothetical protein
VSEIWTITEGFVGNVAGVAKLIHFDREILDIAVGQVEELHTRLLSAGFDNAALNAEKTLTLLSSVRRNDSLRNRYSVIFNQAVVLLVSYFGSAVEDLFKLGVTKRLDRDEDSNLLKEELRLTIREIRERGWNLRESAADLLVEKKDLSFQDMQAIRRAFHEYLGIEIERDKVVNNIILAQACRHVIVHSGGVVTSRLIRQIQGAVPRDLKLTLTEGEPVQFEPQEIEVVSGNMTMYVEGVARKLSVVVAT